MIILYIDRHDGRGYRQYMYDPAEIDTVKALMLEGLENGWRMEYIPA